MITNADDGDVVVLTVRGGGLGDGFGWQRGEAGRSVKAEEITRIVAGFGDSVGEEREVVAGVELQSGDVVAGAGDQAPRLAGQISLERVSFRYGPKLDLAVRDVSVEVRPGECIAIVGRSGSGKTTLGRLLLGLYEPTQGQVALDGIPLAQLELRSVRRQFGVVTQKPHIFGTTIRANIALADPELPLARVRAAARRACIDEDITRMSMQYDTPVVAAGASLSGGQRQRIALARALLDEPAVLLLDEATSALDSITEAAVQAQLDTLPCTRIYIAHRLSTVVAAD